MGSYPAPQNERTGNTGVQKLTGRKEKSDEVN